jgi:twitching motility protein PilU
MKIKPYLKLLAENDGSDIYFSTDAVPSAKFNGVLKQIGKETLPTGYVEVLANEIMNER